MLLIKILVFLGLFFPSTLGLLSAQPHNKTFQLYKRRNDPQILSGFKSLGEGQILEGFKDALSIAHCVISCPRDAFNRVFVRYFTETDRDLVTGMTFSFSLPWFSAAYLLDEHV